MNTKWYKTSTQAQISSSQSVGSFYRSNYAEPTQRNPVKLHHLKVKPVQMSKLRMESEVETQRGDLNSPIVTLLSHIKSQYILIEIWTQAGNKLRGSSNLWCTNYGKEISYLVKGCKWLAKLSYYSPFPTSSFSISNSVGGTLNWNQCLFLVERISSETCVTDMIMRTAWVADGIWD